MSGYYGTITPPRIDGLYRAARERLRSEVLDGILGGAGRIRLGTEPYPAEEAESGYWGRIVLREPGGPAAERAEQPGRDYRGRIQATAEIRPDGRNVGTMLSLIQAHVFSAFHGWRPGAITEGGVVQARVNLFVTRNTQPTPPRKDPAMGLWYSTSVYDYVAESPDTGGE